MDIHVLHFKELGDTESVVTNASLGVYLVIDKCIHLCLDTGCVCVCFFGRGMGGDT